MACVVVGHRQVAHLTTDACMVWRECGEKVEMLDLHQLARRVCSPRCDKAGTHPDNGTMEFAHSPCAPDLRQRLEAFVQRYLLPYNAAWHRSVQDGVYPPPFLEDLKSLAREEGRWNLFLSTLAQDEPGTRLTNLGCAPPLS